MIFMGSGSQIRFSLHRATLLHCLKSLCYAEPTGNFSKNIFIYFINFSWKVWKKWQNVIQTYFYFLRTAPVISALD